MKSVKLLFIFLFFVLTFLLRAEVISVVYDKYVQDMNIEVTSEIGDISKMPIKEVQKIIAKNNDPTKMQKEGCYKMVFTGREYGYSADTAIKKGKFNVNGGGAIYYDMDKQQSLQTTMIGNGPDSYEIRVVESKMQPYVWTIEKDTQTIAGYLCKKAFLGKNPNANYLTIAWFCVALPYNIGPHGYMDLPGLIVRIEFTSKEWGGVFERYDLSSYSVLKDEAINIIPPKGKRVETTEITTISTYTTVVEE